MSREMKELKPVMILTCGAGQEIHRGTLTNKDFYGIANHCDDNCPDKASCQALQGKNVWQDIQTNYK